MAVMHLEKAVGAWCYRRYSLAYDLDPVLLDLSAGSGKQLLGRQPIEAEVFADFRNAFDPGCASIEYDSGPACSTEE
jgi:hypothetical protein